MKILSDRGLIKFFPETTTQKTELLKKYEDLEIENNYLTFKFLINLPRVSFNGLKFGNLVARENFASDDLGEILEANRFVFDIETRKLVELENVKLKTGFYGKDEKYFDEIILSGTYLGTTGKQIRRCLLSQMTYLSKKFYCYKLDFYEEK